jgi:hypothetical protein
VINITLLDWLAHCFITTEAEFFAHPSIQFGCGHGIRDRALSQQFSRRLMLCFICSRQKLWRKVMHVLSSQTVQIIHTWKEANDSYISHWKAEEDGARNWLDHVQQGMPARSLAIF